MLTLKQHDTGIGIKATIENENGAVDLTGADVLFFMGDFKLYPTVTDDLNGGCLVIFEKEHTAHTGIYKAEFEVTYSDGRTETFPNDDYLKVRIMRDLGGK